MTPPPSPDAARGRAWASVKCLQPAPWDLARIREEIRCAEQFDSPISFITVLMIVAHLRVALIRASTLVPDVIDEFTWFPDLGSGVALSDGAAEACGTLQAGLDLLPLLGAVERFLDELPDGPAIWVHHRHAGGGWIELGDGEEAVVARVLERTGQRVLGPQWRIIGTAGFDTLPYVILRDHRCDATPTPIHADVDLWTWDEAAARLRRCGPGWAAFHTWSPHSDEVDFRQRHHGVVTDARAVIFSIGMRDGWWQEVHALAGQRGLGPALALDLDEIWDLYRSLGWAIIDAESTSHLIAPSGHDGPIPSVEQARALYAARHPGDNGGEPSAPWSLEDDDEPPF